MHARSAVMDDTVVHDAPEARGATACAHAQPAPVGPA